MDATPAETPIDDGQRPQRESEKPTEWAKWSAFAAIAALIVNIGTLTAFICVNVQQLRMTRASLGLTRESLSLTRASQEHAYRAWLTVRDAPRLDIGLGKVVTVDVAIENTGRSPAENVRTFPVTAFEASEWQAPLGKRSGEERRLSVIGPQQHRIIAFRTDRRLTEADIEALETRRKRLFFFADVVFSDRFGDDRLLRFCAYFAPPDEPGRVHTLSNCGIAGLDSVK